MMLVKSPVFGYHNGLLQKGGDVMKGHIVMNVPPVLVGHRQGDAISIQDLNFSDLAAFKIKGMGQGLKVLKSFPDNNTGAGGEKTPDDEDRNGCFMPQEA
jgi:hypothetical protein